MLEKLGQIKIWVDDVRPAPEGYHHWFKSVNETIDFIQTIDGLMNRGWGTEPIEIELIDLDHDAGDYANDGGDYIKILDWLEKEMYDIPIRIHSMNPVGRKNMERIIQRNFWKEVY